MWLYAVYLYRYKYIKSLCVERERETRKSTQGTHLWVISDAALAAHASSSRREGSSIFRALILPRQCGASSTAPPPTYLPRGCVQQASGGGKGRLSRDLVKNTSRLIPWNLARFFTMSSLLYIYMPSSSFLLEEIFVINFFFFTFNDEIYLEKILFSQIQKHLTTFTRNLFKWKSFVILPEAHIKHY